MQNVYGEGDTTESQPRALCWSHCNVIPDKNITLISCFEFTPSSFNSQTNGVDEFFPAHYENNWLG